MATTCQTREPVSHRAGVAAGQGALTAVVDEVNHHDFQDSHHLIKPRQCSYWATTGHW